MVEYIGRRCHSYILHHVVQTFVHSHDDLQWNGTVTSTLIESGSGWMNFVAQSTSLPITIFVGSLTQAIVDGGKLPSYAISADEKAFFASHNVSTLYTPLLHAAMSGYNSGNVLIGLWIGFYFVVCEFGIDMTCCGLIDI
jgi:hypothetical protein